MAEHVLSADNSDQLAVYLRFLRRKRDAAIAEVAAEFKELKETRLINDSYEAYEVEDLLDGLLSVIRTTMKRDLQSTMFSSVLLLKQILEQAEHGKVGVSIDIPSTEDMGLLRAVEEWDQNVHGSSGSAPPLRARAAVARAAPSRALPVIGQTQDPKLLADLQNAHDDNSTLQERFQRLQVQCTDILREKSHMQEQIEAMSQGAAGWTQSRIAVALSYGGPDLALLKFRLSGCPLSQRPGHRRRWTFCGLRLRSCSTS
mmetsp:Transcript_12549/g.25220  ORF Transcript_12549/g.25220 Transcript_12549/m.25220 type:complete len:258 (-) Transcript_12549:1116-1889(-)